MFEPKWLRQSKEIYLVPRRPSLYVVCVCIVFERARYMRESISVSFLALFQFSSVVYPLLANMATWLDGYRVPAVLVYVKMWTGAGRWKHLWDHMCTSPCFSWRQGRGDRMLMAGQWIRDYSPSMHGIHPATVDRIEFEVIHGTDFVGEWYWRYRFDYGMDNELVDYISVSRLHAGI